MIMVNKTETAELEPDIISQEDQLEESCYKYTVDRKIFSHVHSQNHPYYQNFFQELQHNIVLREYWNTYKNKSPEHLNIDYIYMQKSYEEFIDSQNPSDIPIVLITHNGYFILLYQDFMCCSAQVCYRQDHNIYNIHNIFQNWENEKLKIMRIKHNTAFQLQNIQFTKYYSSEPELNTYCFK